VTRDVFKLVVAAEIGAGDRGADVVVKYGGIPSLDQWAQAGNSTFTVKDPLVWTAEAAAAAAGQTASVRLEIEAAREGWYYISVFDTSQSSLKVQTQHTGEGRPISVVVSGRSLKLACADIATRTTDAKNVASNKCFRFQVPASSSSCSVSVGGSPQGPAHVRWQGFPVPKMRTRVTGSSKVVRSPKPGLWYIYFPFRPELVPEVKCRLTAGTQRGLDMALGASALHRSWALPPALAQAANSQQLATETFVLHIGPDEVGGELRLSDSAALFATTDLSQTPVVAQGGLWHRPQQGSYILALSPPPDNSTGWQGSQLVASMAPCPGDCNNRGSCSIAQHGSLQYGVCSSCLRYSTLSEFGGMVVLLAASNLALVPAVARAYKMGLVAEAAVFLVLLCASAAYHICDSGVFCFGLSYSSLHLLDFTVSFYAIAVTVIHCWNYQGAVKSVVSVLSLLVIVVCNMQDTSQGQYIPLAVLLFLLVVVPIAKDRAFRFPQCSERKVWLSFCVALACIAAAAGIQYGVLDPDNYFYVHAFWHILGQLSPFFALPWQRTGALEVEGKSKNTAVGSASAEDDKSTPLSPSLFETPTRTETGKRKRQTAEDLLKDF